ncbi:MAG: DNA-directed RNA polymerase, partial [Pseudomonadota bacterium]
WDGLEPETLAYLALKGLVDHLPRQPKLTAAAQRIGGLVEEEQRARLATRSGAVKRPLRAASLSRRASRILDAAGVAKWTARARQLVGLRLLHLVVETLDLAEIVEGPPEGGGRRRPLRVIARPRLSDAAARARDAAALIAPVFEPMVAPPQPWRSVWEGGYLTPQLNGLRLVKTNERETLRALTRERAPGVFKAINAAQATPWAVNRRLLAAMEAVDADPAAAAAADLPLSALEIEAGPEAEEPGGTISDQAARAARWEKALGARQSRSRRLAFDRMLAQARRYSELDALYFPHQFDFRGRLYAVSEFSPQGPDPMKALLHFAKSAALGAEGGRWLAIHLCNCGDFERMSKAPLAARVDWTRAQEERILTVAADPLADLWWTEADQPWQFLAACFEWEGFVGEGEAYRSRLPIALDGSCSGIQHFSLALRDEVGGAAVNLGPQKAAAPAADIYAQVAARLEGLVRADLESADRLMVGRDAEGRPKERRVAELARAWLDFGITRKLCKRPTMTYGYGAGGYGYVEQILEDTLGPARAAHAAREAAGPRAEGGDPDALARWPFDGRGFGEALYLSRRMTEAIEQTVLKAAEAMRWLQHVADAAAAAGAPLAWTAPDGFPVRQAYRERHDRRVKTQLAGRPLRLTLREEGVRLDARRQRQGVAPNYVHTLDAAHLRAVVRRASAEGMGSFALVHDSFGVHAADSGRFFQLIRETMVEMYDQRDVVAQFRAEIAAQLPDHVAAALEPPPDPGRLELDAVLENEHCFS